MSPMFIIKLPNPQLCEDCPCMSHEELGNECNLGYWPYGMTSHKIDNPDGTISWVYNRPEKCIEAHGE